ncbi:NACHT, LRR and PYD domains-containing protein 12 isoform X2 [Trichosurus vulpecula]|uniref:NACHT, LRR and PYD domains-containing protein 12 isoform X2 n=1 Tax=Trichosurus vulpecula TaxID=9337 RepID=UPI00186B15EE|nr:NACHT, LRR and PYD domains-containing protein 12 isoform X2 [Trichosurus vulpecula]
MGMADTILCCLAGYLEELESAELTKFKMYLGLEAKTERKGRVPRGRMEKAGPLDMAQILVAHWGPAEAWELALRVFNRINRKDLWERGCQEPLVRDVPRSLEVAALESCGRESGCLAEAFPGVTKKDPQETYRLHVRRKYRFIEDRNARLGELVNLSQRYTRLLLVKEHATLTRAQYELLATGRQHALCLDQRASPIQIETLFEPDEERPDAPHTVVLQGAAGIGKSILAQKVMLDWADGRLYSDRFDYLFYLNCREMNQVQERSVEDLISVCWPERNVPISEIVRVPERLLFIIDGFDELRASFHESRDCGCIQWAERKPVEALLSCLLRRKLIPELSLLITTRPTTLETLRRLLEHPRHVEILGFSEEQRQEYFYKFFRHEEQARQGFSLVRDNEPLFTMCFVPMMCWIVCTCLKQQLEAGWSFPQTSKTTTAVYTFYLLSLLQPKQGKPRVQPPPNLRGLCSLAAAGLWSQRILFEEEDLHRHGLEGDDVSAFLNMNIFHKDIQCERYYSFIHLSFQEFFAAMFYVLEGEPGASPANLRRLLHHYTKSHRSYLVLTMRFLFGLLNEERRSSLEKQLGWKTSGRTKRDLLRWIQAKAESEGSTLQRGALEIFECLYEIQEEDFIQRSLDHFQVVAVSDMATKMEHMVSSFCVRNCRSALVVHLGSAMFTADGEDTESKDRQELVSEGMEQPLNQPLKLSESNVLPEAYCEHLATALSTNRNLVELVLYRNALGNRGVRLLCQGLRHPNCQLQNLRLKRCRISSAACQDIASALMTNQNLTRLDLSRNMLGAAGVKLLCEGLQHPKCRLQMLQLRRCQVDGAACQELSRVLSTSHHLTELDLTGNALGDLGLQHLCPGLSHPACKLKTLWLKICHLTPSACQNLSSVLSTNQNLTELDLSLNDLGDLGVKSLCEGLCHSKSQLQTLRLGICRLTCVSCEALSTTLQSNIHLKELDVSFNDLEDMGVHLLCEGLRHPKCKLHKLWLDSCCLSGAACKDLASALGANQTLRELYLTNNTLGDTGVQLLCERLSQPNCRLRTLWLFGMELTEGTQRALAALRGSKPHLDIGS